MNVFWRNSERRKQLKADIIAGPGAKGTLED